MSSSDPNKFEQVPALTVVREGDVVKRSGSDLVGSGIPTPSPDHKNASEGVSGPSSVPTKMIEAIGCIVRSPELPQGEDYLYRVEQVQLVGQSWMAVLQEVPPVSFVSDWVEKAPVLHAPIENFQVVFTPGNTYSSCSLQPGDEVALLQGDLVDSLNLPDARLGSVFMEGRLSSFLVGEVEEVLEKYGLVKLLIKESDDRSSNVVIPSGNQYGPSWYARETLVLVRRPVPPQATPDKVILTYNFSEYGIGGLYANRLRLGLEYRVQKSCIVFHSSIPCRVFDIVDPDYGVCSVPEYAVSLPGPPLLSSPDVANRDTCYFGISGTTVLRTYAASSRINSTSLSGRVVRYLRYGQWWESVADDGYDVKYRKVPSQMATSEEVSVAYLEPGALVRLLPEPARDVLDLFPPMSSPHQVFLQRNTLTAGMVMTAGSFVTRPGVLCADGIVRGVPLCCLSAEGMMTEAGFKRARAFSDMQLAIEDCDSADTEWVHLTLAGVCGAKEATVIYVGRRRECHIENYILPKTLEKVQKVLDLPEGSLVRRITPEEADGEFVNEDVYEDEEGNLYVTVCRVDSYPSRLYVRDAREIGSVLLYSREGNQGATEFDMDETEFKDLAWISQVQVEVGNLLDLGKTLDLGTVVDVTLLAGLTSD